MKYLMAVMRANFYAYIRELMNNKGFMFFMLFWPYMMAFFMFGIGSMLGSIEEYSENMGVANPILYILASSSIMLSSISIVDNVAGELLRHKWLGTLPYIVSSPPRLILYAIAGPIPSTLLSSFVNITVILPAVIAIEGLIGGFKLFIVLMLIYLGMIPLIGIAVMAGGLSLIAGEDSNVASFLTPFILLVSGVFYPQTILPYILQLIGKCFPLVYIVEATKILATYKYPPFTMLYSIIGFLIGLSVIYNLLTAPGVVWIEKKVLERGVYEE